MTPRPTPLLALVMAALLASPARAEDAAGAPADPATEVTTEEWREPEVPADLLWHALALPEYATELLLSPLGILISAVERHRLDKRLYDLLRNDAGTIYLIPNLKIAFGDGLGLGGKLTFKDFFGGEQRLDFSGVYLLNADYELGARYRHAFAVAEGRELDLRVDYEVDRNLPYFGIGNVADVEKHVLRSDVLDAAIAFDMTGRGVPDLIGVVEFGFRYEELGRGEAPGTPAIGAPEAVLAPPVGFGETVGFPRFRAAIQYDTRDTNGRPRRGMVASIEGMYTQDVSDAEQSAMTGRVQIGGYVPLLPERRVLHFGFGFGGAVHGRPGDEIPLHALMTLGRKNGLRGYDRARFRDELGWWGTLEYQFPVYEYMSTAIALTPMIFVDVGRVAGSVDELFEGPVRYSTGFGVRGAHDIVPVLGLQLGFSPEGIAFDFSLIKEL